MIGEPRWFAHAPTKPGYGDPKPAKPVHTCDTPENVAVCLDCPVPGGCRMELPICPLHAKTRRDEIVERDGKIRDLINAGWVNQEAICEELGINKGVYYAARRRLRERGEIN